MDASINETLATSQSLLDVQPQVPPEYLKIGHIRLRTHCSSLNHHNKFKKNYR